MQSLFSESGGNVSYDLAELLADPRLRNRNAGLPWLFHTHQRECAPSQSSVLHEINHVCLAFLGIFIAPEVMHDGGDARKESDDCRGAKFRLHAEQQTCAAHNEWDCAQRYRDVGLGYALGLGVWSHLLTIS